MQDLYAQRCIVTVNALRKKRDLLFCIRVKRKTTAGDQIRIGCFSHLGCKVNSYELDIMRQIPGRGLQECFPEEADIYVVNTCTVTNIATARAARCSTRPKSRIRMQLLRSAVMWRQIRRGWTGRRVDPRRKQKVPDRQILTDFLRREIISKARREEADSLLSGRISPSACFEDMH